MGVLKALWQNWKILARKIGDFQARLILAVFYFVLLAPFALAVKLFADPLHIKINHVRGWFPSRSDEHPAVRARRQF